jgi:hypothetical protein
MMSANGSECVFKVTAHVGRQSNTNTISMLTDSRVKYLWIKYILCIDVFHRWDLESTGVTPFYDLTVDDQYVFDIVHFGFM